MDPSENTSVRAFLIFLLCEHCIESVFKESTELLKDGSGLKLDDPLENLLLDKEISKFFLYWATELSFQYSTTIETGDSINSIIISLFEEKYPIKFSEVEEYADIPDSSEKIQKFGKNISRTFDIHDAIVVYQLNIIMNATLKAMIQSISTIFHTPSNEIRKMLQQ